MKFSLCTNHMFKLESIERVNINLPDIDPGHPIKRYIKLKDGILSNYKGYVWDGSSIPFKGIIKFLSFGLIDFDRYCKIASLHHDSTCQLIRLGLLDRRYKQYIDEFYKKECIEGEMSKVEANTRYWWMRRFKNAGIKERKHPKGEILEI